MYRTVMLLVGLSASLGSDDSDVGAVVGANDEGDDGMFTSSTDLVGLVHTQSELVNRLENYITEERLRLGRLEKLLDDYKSVRNQASRSGEQFVGNPLNSFLLIKKLTSDWKQVEALVLGGSGDQLLKNISRERDYYGLKWPKDEDLNGAALGLMRLQDTYRLDTTKLANGVLNGKFYGPELTAQDCFELGRQTYNNGDYFHTNIWMEEALKKNTTVKMKSQFLRQTY